MGYTAFGHEAPNDLWPLTDDPADVTCGRCRGTVAFAIAVSEKGTDPK